MFSHIKKSLFLFFTFFCCQSAYSKEFKLDFIKVNLSRPETLHFLIYEESSTQEKISFELDPLNNERLGLFFSINDFIVGYNADVFKNRVETDTVDIFLSYQKFKNSQFSINYQRLKGFNTKASGGGGRRESLFIDQTRSIKYELKGSHNFHTFLGKSTFDHFFLNKIDSDFDQRLSLSLVGDWSVRRFKLESKGSILFTPSFSQTPLIPDFKNINALSYNVDVGPMFSFSLNKNIRSFLQARIGAGFFKNFDGNDKLKQSGFENIQSFGVGASWLSDSKKSFLNFKFRMQEGRHIETAFGDLSFIYFFE